MKKRKAQIAVFIIVAVASLLLVFIFFKPIIKKYICSIGQESVVQINDASQYQGRNAFFDVEYEDYKGHLLGFPEETAEELEIERYYYYRDELALDNTYKIFLSYHLNQKEYEKEKERVGGVHVTYQGEEHRPIYTEQGFDYPAYVMSYKKDGVYEYVLFDDEKQRIICIYSQMGDWKRESFAKEYMPVNFSLPEQYKDGYNMYYFKTEKGNEVLPELDGVGLKA